MQLSPGRICFGTYQNIQVIVSARAMMQTRIFKWIGGAFLEDIIVIHSNRLDLPFRPHLGRSLNCARRTHESNE